MVSSRTERRRAADRALYRWLTDRIGNFEELLCYVPLWRHFVGQGVVILFVVGMAASAGKYRASARGRTAE